VLPTVPITEPTELTAGDSWQWDRTLPGFPPADGWTLRYALRGPGRLDIEAQPAGGVYQVRVAAAETTKLPAGSYRWAMAVEHEDGRRHTIATGRIQVAADFAQLEDGLTHAERTLRVIHAAIEGRLTADIESYSINGRAVNKIPLEQLLKLRGHYRSEVRRERNGGRWGRAEVHFGRLG